MILKNMGATSSAPDSTNPIDRGIEGERQVAFYLKQEFVDDPDILVIHDLRLSNGNDNYAQTDHIVIDTKRRLIWSAETKNFNGTLRCNRHGDWEVDYQRRTYQIESPTEQARRHTTSLRRFLEANGFTGFEIEPIVLLHPKMKVDRKGLDDDIPVIKSDNFVAAIRKRQGQVFDATPLSAEDRHRLGDELLKANRPGTFGREQHKTVSIARSNGSDIRRSRSNRSSLPTNSPGEALASIFVIILIMWGASIFIPKILTDLAPGIEGKRQNSASTTVATGILMVVDQTGTPTKKQITAISLTSGRTAGLTIQSGRAKSLTLKQGVYRVEGRADGYRVTFGSVTILKGKTAVVNMGAPGQFMQVIQAR